MGDDPVEEEPGVHRLEPVDRQRGDAVEVRERVVVVARGEEERDALGVQAPGDEREHGTRLLIEPLRVVDAEEQRTPRCELGEE